MGTVIVIIGFAVVGPAPYFGLVKGHYTMVCMGLSVSKAWIIFERSLNWMSRL